MGRPANPRRKEGEKTRKIKKGVSFKLYMQNFMQPTTMPAKIVQPRLLPSPEA